MLATTRSRSSPGIGTSTPSSCSSSGLACAAWNCLRSPSRMSPSWWRAASSRACWRCACWTIPVVAEISACHRASWRRRTSSTVRGSTASPASRSATASPKFGSASYVLSAMSATSRSRGGRRAGRRAALASSRRMTAPGLSVPTERSSAAWSTAFTARLLAAVVSLSSRASSMLRWAACVAVMSSSSPPASDTYASMASRAYRCGISPARHSHSRSPYRARRRGVSIASKSFDPSLSRPDWQVVQGRRIDLPG
jgi:hypothetical protein